MAITAINGYGGTLTFASATLNVKNYTLTGTEDEIDTTNVGDAGWKSFIVGPKGYTVSCEASFDSAAVPTGTAGFTLGTSGTVTLLVGNTGKSYTGTGHVKGFTVKNDPKADVTFNVDFQGTGALGYAS